MKRLEARDEVHEEEANLMLDMISTPGMTPEMVNRNIIDLFIAGIDSVCNYVYYSHCKRLI